MFFLKNKIFKPSSLKEEKDPEDKDKKNSKYVQFISVNDYKFKMRDIVNRNKFRNEQL